MLVRLAVAFLLFMQTALQAQSEERLALLIGNQNYGAKIGALKNPHTDIALVAEALRSIGFKVTEIKDADYKTIDTAIKRHIQAVRREGDGSISFLYYSGHGAADSGTKTNYLIPVDVVNADDENLWINSLNLNNVVENLQGQAPNATHYVIFDACRNELNLTRKGQKALTEKGFVPLAYTPGVMIAYATAPGRTASDTGSQGGPYAKALAAEITKPGIEALSMFRRVALRVNREIGQDPWMSASTLPEIYLAGRPQENAFGTKQQPSVGEGPAAPFSPTTAGGFFAEDDSKRLRSLTEKHRILLPDFQIDVPESDVPTQLRRYIGVWFHDAPTSVRAHIFVATRVHKDGKLDGYWAWGPTKPETKHPNPAAGFWFVSGTVTGDSFRFNKTLDNFNGSFRLTLTAENKLKYLYTNPTRGEASSGVFSPIWTLVTAEAAAKR